MLQSQLPLRFYSAHINGTLSESSCAMFFSDISSWPETRSCLQRCSLVCRQRRQCHCEDTFVFMQRSPQIFGEVLLLLHGIQGGSQARAAPPRFRHAQSFQLDVDTLCSWDLGDSCIVRRMVFVRPEDSQRLLHLPFPSRRRQRSRQQAALAPHAVVLWSLIFISTVLYSQAVDA